MRTPLCLQPRPGGQPLSPTCLPTTAPASLRSNLLQLASRMAPCKFTSCVLAPLPRAPSYYPGPGVIFTCATTCLSTVLLHNKLLYYVPCEFRYPYATSNSNPYYNTFCDPQEDPPEWREGEFTVYGKWMDGWETRRKRKPGHDWCIIRLGMPGTIAGVDVDTSYFTGNYAPRVSVQAATLAGPEERQLPQRVGGMGCEASEVELTQAAKLNSQNWTTIIPITEAKPGYHDTCHNFLQVTPATSTTRYTHIRLNIFPDGGVARFRVFGSAVPNWSSVSHSQMVDLAAAVSGGSCVGYSDAHYGHPRNLISPGRGINMGDGWETARRLDRPPVLIEDERGVLKVSGYEWAILRLGHTGTVHELEIDTHHFKGNFPDSCRVDGCLLPLDSDLQYIKEKAVWKTILPSQKLHSHTQHHFKQEVTAVGPVSHVRVVMAPDGGISRVRVLGKIFNKL